MGTVAVGGAGIICPFGSMTACLNVTSQMVVRMEGKLAATIQDAKAMINIPSFGMCSSMGNPQVAAATAAALGVLMPQPCIPAPLGCWTSSKPGILVSNIPCLTNDARLMCSYGGCLAITNPGTGKISI